MKSLSLYTTGESEIDYAIFFFFELEMYIVQNFC